MFVVTPGAIVPPGPWATAIPLSLLLLGVVGIAGGWAVSGRRLIPTLNAAAPRLFPLGRLWLNLAVFVLIMIGAASTFHALFDVFTSAHNGGDTTAVEDQVDLDGLLIGASVVVWILTLYAVLAIARAVRMGRLVDAHRGPDPYGQRVEPPTAEERPSSVGVPLAPPAPPYGRAVVLVVTGLYAFGISASIQVLEVNVGAAPFGDWLWSQLLTPAWAVLVGAGIGGIDRAIRELEVRYAVIDRVERAEGTPVPAA